MFVDSQNLQAIRMEAEYLVDQELISYELDLESFGASIGGNFVAYCIASLVVDADSGTRRTHKYYNLQYERRVVIFKQRVVQYRCPHLVTA
jgi:hypothetical protein